MAVDPPLDDETKFRVLRALESPKFKWRTIEGVTGETGLPPATVIQILNSCRGSVVKSAVPSPKGEDLYTTTGHHRKTAGALNRFLGALKNRID